MSVWPKIIKKIDNGKTFLDLIERDLEFKISSEFLRVESRSADV